MSIDWERTLSQHGVDFVSRGPNVKRGNVNVKCPFCGNADPSHHLGIDLQSGKWGCWRNDQHRGKSPVRLLVALLKLPVWEVLRIVGISDAPDLSTFSDIRARLTDPAGNRSESAAVESLEFPGYMHPISASDDLTARFYWYLRDERGFGADTSMVCLMYTLRCALMGDQRGRVIFPYFYRGALVTWTGRAITKHAELRYRDLNKDSSVIYKNDVLFNYDKAVRGGRVLIVVEGPIDTLKLDWVGRHREVRAVGLSTNNISQAQAAMLAEVASLYDYVYIGMDQPDDFARMASVRMCSKLAFLADVAPLPRFPFKDFGEAPLHTIDEFIKEEVHSE